MFNYKSTLIFINEHIVLMVKAVVCLLIPVSLDRRRQTSLRQ